MNNIILKNIIREEVKKLNEEFQKLEFHSHKNHNPECDILCGYLNDDTYICYGIYVKGENIGKEFMEFYTGSNYSSDSTKKSYSRHFVSNKIPSKYKDKWLQLKQIYNSKYKKIVENIDNDIVNKELKIIKQMGGLSNTSANIWAMRYAKENGYVILKNNFWYLTKKGEDYVNSLNEFKKNKSLTESFLRFLIKEVINNSKGFNPFFGSEINYICDICGLPGNSCEHKKENFINKKNDEKMAKISNMTQLKEFINKEIFKLLNEGRKSIRAKKFEEEYGVKMKKNNEEEFFEVAPPGREKQIKKLKKKFGSKSPIPYKIAWSQYNKNKKNQ